MRARPCAEATLISPWDLRLSVILLGAAVPCLLPCARRRNVKSSILASSLIMSFAPETRIPASSSCVSSRSTGTSQYLGKLANSHIRHIRPPDPLLVTTPLKPVAPRCRTSAYAPP